MEIRFDHIAVGVPEGARAIPFLVGELGGRRYASGPGAGFRFWQWRYAGGGVLELLEPDGPPGGFLHRFLDARGPGVHHVTFKVADIAAAMGRAEAHGYRVVGFNEDFPGWKEAFLHPKQAQGIVVQLAQVDAELDGDGGDPSAPGADGQSQWPFPPEPDSPPPPVTLVGLRLAAASAERARRQWQGLLGARCRERGAVLRFAWPESPLQLSVTIDASAEEGPLGIEIAPPDERPLPEGPHEVLGAGFLRVAPDEPA